MKISKLLFLLLFVFCVPAGYAQEKYSKVSIPATSAIVRNFIFSRLNVDHYETVNGAIITVLNTREMTDLRQSGHPFTLLADDAVQQTILENRDIQPGERPVFQGVGCQRVASIIGTPSRFGLGGSLRLGAAAGNPGYFTYAQMVTEMQSLATAYPALVSVYSIGSSALGQNIYGVKISKNVSIDEAEPEVLYTGLQHAREAIGGTSLVFFMQYLAENYGLDNKVTQLLTSREIFIIPCVNPDGYAFNYSGSSASYPVTGGGLWRKNRRHTGGVASNIGVDLNRNYGIDWGNCSGATSSCGSSVKTEETYYGPSAFSEPETQALRAFVFTRHFINAIDQHCHGSYYSLPYGRPSLHTPLSHIDSSYYRHIPALMGMYNGHRAGNSPETVNYEVAGGIKDWLLMGDIGSGTVPKTKIYGMTGEAGGGDFWAPVSQIIPLCKELCFQNLQLALAAGNYFDIQDLNPIATSADTGYFKFRLKRIGLAGSAVTVSLMPLHNMNSVGAPVIKTLANYYDEVIDSIRYVLPATFVCGQKIDFAWKVEAGGITMYDTVTKFFNPLNLLSDNMEGSFATNWTANPTGANAWGFTNSHARSGNFSMTESPSGNYTTSSTRIATYKYSLDLSDASASYLSFWIKHYAENFRDKLQVQLSHDNVTWVAACGSEMVAEGNTTSGGTLGEQPAYTGIRDNWTRVQFNLNDYIGDASVYLRFRFTSDADGGSFAFERDQGFHIDDISLIKTTNISTIPVKFGAFNAQLLFNKTVHLDWEAYTDAEHDYFEVQRATDRNSQFAKIGIVTGTAPYSDMDIEPADGNNYYRIKEVNKSGNVTYSPVIKVSVSNTIRTSVYPNPVREVLGIRIQNNLAKADCIIRILDATGHVVVEERRKLLSGSSVQELKVHALPPQVYFVQVLNSHGETVARDRFIKL